MEAVWKNKYLRVLSIALVAEAVLFYTVSHGDSRPLRQPLKEFPGTLTGWQSIGDGIIDKDAMAVLKADDVLTRFYLRSSVPDLNHMSKEMKVSLRAKADELFLAYFSTQQTGQSPHSPKNCLPGAGWQPSETGQLTLSVPGMAPIAINKYVVSRADHESVVLYWYQSHGRVVANEFAAKFYTVADSMRYHRSDTALVRIVAPVGPEGAEVAVKDATDFAQTVYPVILSYLPK